MRLFHSLAFALVPCLLVSSALPAEGTGRSPHRRDAQEEGASCSPAPPTIAITEYSDIVYATVPRGDGLGSFGLMMDVHVPSPGDRYPALIFVHGGGWVAGSRTGADGTGSNEEAFAQYYAAHGPFVVFNIDYRMPCDQGDPSLEYFDGTPHLSPRAAICNAEGHSHPVPLTDVRAAINWVKKYGALYKADVTKIGIVGDSAGGQLALLSATYDGSAPMAQVKPRVVVAYSPPIDFELAAQRALSNDGTPVTPVPMAASQHGAEFDECAYLWNIPELGGLGWMNDLGTYCAARWYRRMLVGQNYEMGSLPEQVASREAWKQASPRFWVGNTRPLSPDPPVYFFIGEGELRILEEEGESFIDAASSVSTMTGSAFCRLSAENATNGHAADLAGRQIEPGCYGYDAGAPSQMTILESTLRFLQEYLPHCGNGPPTVASLGDVIALEGHDGVTRFELPVTLSLPAPTSIALTYATLDGSAQAGVDYVPATGVVVIPAGRTQWMISIDVLGDPDVEEDETLRVRITGATGAALGDPTGIATIVNDDDLPDDEPGESELVTVPRPQRR